MLQHRPESIRPYAEDSSMCLHPLFFAQEQSYVTELFCVEQLGESTSYLEGCWLIKVLDSTSYHGTEKVCIKRSRFFGQFEFELLVICSESLHPSFFALFIRILTWALDRLQHAVASTLGLAAPCASFASSALNCKVSAPDGQPFLHSSTKVNNKKLIQKERDTSRRKTKRGLKVAGFY